MEDFYALLGVNSSATPEELRRAYRILARRYHPDVNPGKASEEKFKSIAEAYSTLSDPDRRRSYDIDYELMRRKTGDARINAYRRQHEDQFRARSRYYAENEKKAAAQAQAGPKAPPTAEVPPLFGELRRAASNFAQTAGAFVRRKPRKTEAQNQVSGTRTPRLSIIEVSVSMRDAIVGVKKTIEIAEPEGTRKVSVRIPPGVKNGSVIRLRANNQSAEELVMILRVASHPFLSIQAKGLVAEIPVTIQEALQGASITVPGLEESLVVKIPAGSQSGTELRIHGKGIRDRDGNRGDLFYRLLIKLPSATEAPGLKEKTAEVEKYYESGVRQSLPARLLEAVS